MPHPDALRWDARYQERILRGPPEPHRLLVQHADLLPTSGLALDAACGLGADAGFLLERGLQVIGVDISIVALRQAKQHQPALMALAADLTFFHLPPAAFDVLLNFYYLQRDLWPAFTRSLRPGGLLFFETYMQNRREPDLVRPAHLLASGELTAAFGNLQVVAYAEGERPGRGRAGQAVASMVARKPQGSNQ